MKMGALCGRAVRTPSRTGLVEKAVGFQRVQRAKTAYHLLNAYLFGFEAVPIHPAHTPG